ncbi:MAG: DNA-binding domain-containing protein [Pseudomonadota bacterium]
MPSLSDGQAAFARAILDPLEPAPSDIQRPTGLPHTAPQVRRFDIYRNNVTVAAIDALGDSFPCVRTLVGEEFFRATARAFLDKSRPRSPLLFRYGDTFGDFLEFFPPAARSVPYLADVARLEFARLRAFHAGDVNPLSIATLGETADDKLATLVFGIHPSVSLIRSRFPVASLWAATSGLIDSDKVDMNSAEDALVVRPYLEVNTHILPREGAGFLAALLQKKTLQEAAEIGGSSATDFNLSLHLAGLFEYGVFTDISLNENSD